MPIIGTAGHVDHGKSTLVEALTGRDPDRWVEEKERGLTIDLGFAWTNLPGDITVSFVDVPGHERFIKNMLAGTEAIDAALLVVAADEGWKPQTEEHTAVLDLLGVPHGVIAITKADRVDEEIVELVTLEVEERLAGTSLGSATVVAVSAITGAGLDQLRRALSTAIFAAEEARTVTGRPRLWIDRAFSVAGAGTVVTGSLLEGSLRVGEEATVYPEGGSGRIRGLQSHEKELDEAGPGTRTAVNLTGWERQALGRGQMLGLPGQWQLSDRILVGIKAARYVEQPLTDRGAYHFHFGSGAWPVRLRFLDHDVALLRLPEALPVAMADRFILRDVGRRAVVAGGRILDPSPPPRPGPTGRLHSTLDLGVDEQAAALLEVRGVDRAYRLQAHTRGGMATPALSGAELIFSESAAAALVDAASSHLHRFHEKNPRRPGLPKATLASLLDVPIEIVDELALDSSTFRDDGSTVAAAEFAGGLSAKDEAVWNELEQTMANAELAVPRLKDLEVEAELLHALLREGRLVRVSDDLVYLPAQLEKLTAGLDGLPSPFTVAQFRDEFGISRKYAVPLLEWLDAEGVTRREADQRTLR